MKPSSFRYVAPLSVHQALETLRDEADDVRILAGGQSLGPLLNLRLSQPGLIVDINRLTDLDAIRVTPAGDLAIGAVTRQRTVETSPVVAADWGLIVTAISHIGHRATRNRGTVGGSVSHADPAAELPAALTALDASFQIASTAGRRSVPATDFFLGPFSTALRADEMLVGMTIPPTPSGTGHAWLEYSRRHGDFGIIGVAAILRYERGVCAHARLVFSGADWTPWQPPTAVQRLIGNRPSLDLFEEVGRAAAAESSPPEDIHASTAHRRRLIEALTARALSTCAIKAGAERTEAL